MATTFDYKSAKNAGYSDDEIASFLDEQNKAGNEMYIPRGEYESLNPKTQAEKPVPGAETALFPATPLSKTNPIQATKIVPNLGKDVYGVAKGLTVDTAKNIASIPGEASGLIKESGGVIPAAKNLATSFPGAVGTVISSLVPQSLKELANTESISQLPKQFQELVRESGGYAQAFKNIAKSIPDALAPAAEQYLEQIDRAGQAFINHPLYESLGYAGLKELATNPAGVVKQGKEALKTTGEFVKSPVKSTTEAVSTGASDLYKAITAKSPEQIDAYISKKFEKGVRPSVAGKGTASQAEAYQDKSLQAVKTIVENKDALKLTNEYGEAVVGLPKNLKQFADAIDQTKKSIFSKYDALQKSAGESGATVELKPAVDELRMIQNDPTVQDLHPELAKYAQGKADALSIRENYSTQSTQDAIISLNKSLEAFYKNPSYETASRASVDALIANKLRAGLDAVIEETTGAGYQELKNQYGALKTIEKDVVHRAMVDARKNAKELIDLTDVATGAEVIKGIAMRNPTILATGLGAKAIAAYYKYLNNPNTAIKQLFLAAEKSSPVPKPKPVPFNKATVPETVKLQSLAQEARKYKSAEEFVKQFELHGGASKLEGGKLSTKFDKSGGIFTTPSEATAETWRALRSGKTYQVYLGDRKLIDLTEPKTVKKIEGLIGTKYTVDGEVSTFTKQDYDFLFPNGQADWATFSNYIPMFEKMGFKGAKIREGFNVNTALWEDIKPLDNVLTKSQLTDIWNKATSESGKLAKGFDSILDVPLAKEAQKMTLSEFKRKNGFYFEGDTSQNYFKGTADEFWNEVRNQAIKK